jgi:hypothetical protein
VETPGSDDGWRRSLVLEAYRLERAEGTSHLAMQATFVALALTSIGLLSGFLSQVCAVGYAGDTCVEVPDVVLAGMPLVPTAFLAYLAGNVLRATLRSFYLRALERELAGTVPPGLTLRAYPWLGVPRGVELSLHASPAAVRRGGAARVLGAMLIGTLLIGYVGFVVVLVVAVSLPWQLLMVALYGLACGAIIRLGALAVLDGRSYFAQAVRSMNESLSVPLRPRVHPREEGRRTMASYLALPRPDSAPKALIALVAGMLAAVAAARPLLPALPALLLGTAVYELLLYQCRYQLNDLRGIREDQDDVARATRGRLPVVPGRLGSAVRASLVAAGVRIYLAVGLTLFLPRPVQGVLAAAAAALVVLTVLYEAARAWARGADRHGWAVVLPLAVGYALRAALGAALFHAASGGAVPVDGWFVALTLLGAAFGLMFVSATWALHAVCQAGPPTGPDGPGWRLDRARVHERGLLRHVDAAPWASRPDLDWRTVPALAPVTSLRAPSNLAFVATAALTAVFAVAWVEPGAGPGTWWSAGAAVAGAAGAAALTRTSAAGPGGRRRAAPAAQAAAVLLAGVAGAVAVTTVPRAAPLLAAVPLAVTCALYGTLTSLSYAALKSSGADLLARLRAGRRALFRAVVGDATARALTAEREQRTTR